METSYFIQYTCSIEIRPYYLRCLGGVVRLSLPAAAAVLVCTRAA